MIRVKTFTGEFETNTEDAAIAAENSLNEYLAANPETHLCNYQVSTAATTVLIGTRDNPKWWHTFTITAVLSTPESEQAE